MAGRGGTRMGRPEAGRSSVTKECNQTKLAERWCVVVCISDLRSNADDALTMPDASVAAG
eukprot:758718-Prorocentrum_minimum.AAC.1